MSKTTKIIIGIVIIVVIVVLVVVFGGEKGEKEPIKIGASLMLSGPYAQYGEKEQWGIELALDKIGRDRIKIIYEDNQADIKKAVTDVQKLINVDGVKLIIGPDCGSGCTLAAAPITEPAQVIQIAPAASNPGVADAGEYLFTLVALDNYEAKLMAEFVYNRLEVKRTAIICIDDAWGLGIKDVFNEEFTKLGGEVILTESFKRTEKDFRTILTKTKDKNPDVIYAVGYEELIDLFKQMRELKIDKQLLSASMLENIQNIESLKQMGEGVIYTSQLIDINEEFEQEYNSKYGEDPELSGSISYDIIMLLYNAIQKCKEDINCIKDFLYSVKDYKGASGVITINNEGWTERLMSFKTIKNGQFVPLEDF